MKARVFLSCNPGRARWATIARIREDMGCGDLEPRDSILGGYYSHAFDATDPRLEEIRYALKSANITWSERREHIYTPEELRRFPLLWLSIGRAQAAKGGPTHGTRYDMSRACAVCGTGAVQVSALLLLPSELPNKAAIFETYHSEVLVSAETAEALRLEVLTGLELRQVKASTDGRLLPWFQIMAAYEMPPMSPETTGIERERQCRHCRRDGHFHSNRVPIEIRYHLDESTRERLPDVVQTYECFGNSVLKEPFAKSHFAQPLLFVKPRVMDILRAQKVRGLRYDPIWINAGPP